MQWYLQNLRTRPMRTNLATGVVLMSAGDVMAQALERHHAEESLTGHNSDLDGIPLERRLSLRRYGTHGPPLDDELLAQSDDHAPEGPPGVVALQMAWDEVKKEVEFLDYFRVSTMAAWSLLWTTPVMLYFYRFLDHLFPQRTKGTIVARVLLSVVFSIPNNAMFFVYGTCVHHAAEWVAVRQEWREEVEDFFALDQSAITDIVDEGPPFDWEMMLSKAALKVKSELVETVKTSAKVWIPMNLFSFSLVPPHLRPVTLMGFSVFWNCYLSLIQHRDLALPAESSPP